MFSQELDALWRKVSMGWIRASSFYTVYEASSWTQAEQKANNLGGNLITLNNLEEFKWASENIWYDPNVRLKGYFWG